MSLILLNQSYVLYIFFIMVISAVIKHNGVFDDLFYIISKYIKSKRVVIFLISLVSGVLPVPGRVTVTAGILDTIAPSDKKKRAKFGIIDYLSTHHYYLWSPLEKTIIIPMAMLGLSYAGVITLLAPLLIFSLLLSFWYIFVTTKEEDIVLNIKKTSNKGIYNIVPFILGIITIAFGVNPALVFSIISITYYIWFPTPINVIWKNINVKLLIFVFCILVFGNYVHLHTDEINAFISTLPYSINTLIGFISVSILSFGSSFLLGSSARFTGLVSILSLAFGVQYFVYFFALEFSAYLLSPAHKCVIIGNMYFGTKIKDYYKVLIFWSFGLILLGLITLI